MQSFCANNQKLFSAGCQVFARMCQKRKVLVRRFFVSIGDLQTQKKAPRKVPDSSRFAQTVRSFSGNEAASDQRFPLAT